MIKKSILLALIIVAVHSFLIWKFVPNLKASRHQWQYNNIVAQDFFYNSKNWENVIVGSSLSQRLKKEQLPGFFNLSFAGLSLYDGLAILTHKNELPKRVYIEINVVTRGEDKSFTSSLTNPLLSYPRQYLPGMREGRQPLDWVSTGVDKVIDRLASTSDGPITSIGENSIKTDSIRFETSLNRIVENFSVLPDKYLMQESLSNMRRDIETLERRGVQIIFFEMPVNQKLCNSPLSIEIRKDVELAFPPNRFKYIKLPDCSEYHTTDGLHLNKAEAEKYSKYFLSNAF